MKGNSDDPRLTAFAFGELDDAERKAMEAALAASPESRREMDEIDQTAALLQAGLANERLPDLTYAQQLAIEAKLKAGMAKGPKGSRRPALADRFPLSGLRRWLRRAAVLGAAAASLACVVVGLMHLLGGGPATTAFAQIMDQIERASSLTWEQTVYLRHTSSDGLRTWITTQNSVGAYKAPGLYREEMLDAKGRVTRVEIADALHGRRLVLYPFDNKASLSEGVPWYARRGPLAQFEEELRAGDLEWVQARSMPEGKANVFRLAVVDRANGQPWSYDLWINQRTKDLVEVHVPGTDLFNPDTDPARHHPPEAVSARTVTAASVFHHIAYNAQLDDSLFQLEAPRGYRVEANERADRTVNEAEMISFLGLLAECNDRTFPESLFPAAPAADQLNQSLEKPKQERRAAEQKLLEAIDFYKQAGVNEMPISRFVQEGVVEHSFRYLGKGVKLGDSERMVCWYKLRGGLTYRVIYGDLSVKDLPAEALPLPVER
jgi:hypothetical protein